MSGDPLKEYRKKRDFSRTPEPEGSTRRPKSKTPIFVVQKHDASTLHYDFRLEVGDVLISWAAPKGPSTDPREKRLAVRTEDHPVSYADFEGVIPEDEYGGGTVMVWDIGPYRNNKTPKNGEEPPSLRRQVEDGHIAVWLEGSKLRGGYALTKIRMQGGKEQWLLIKMDDDEADARRNPVSSEPRSAITGRTMNQIADEEEPTSFENAAGKSASGSGSKKGG